MRYETIVLRWFSAPSFFEEASKLGVTSSRRSYKEKREEKKEKGQDGEYVCRSSPSHLLFQMAFLEMQAQPQLSGIINFLACENVKSIVQKL